MTRTLTSKVSSLHGKMWTFYNLYKDHQIYDSLCILEEKVKETLDAVMDKHLLFQLKSSSDYILIADLSSSIIKNVCEKDIQTFNQNPLTLNGIQFYLTPEWHLLGKNISAYTLKYCSIQTGLMEAVLEGEKILSNYGIFFHRLSLIDRHQSLLQFDIKNHNSFQIWQNNQLIRLTDASVLKYQESCPDRFFCIKTKTELKMVPSVSDIVREILTREKEDLFVYEISFFCGIMCGVVILEKEYGRFSSYLTTPPELMQVNDPAWKEYADSIQEYRICRLNHISDGDKATLCRKAEQMVRHIQKIFRQMQTHLDAEAIHSTDEIRTMHHEFAFGHDYFSLEIDCPGLASELVRLGYLCFINGSSVFNESGEFTLHSQIPLSETEWKSAEIQLKKLLNEQDVQFSISISTTPGH